MFAGKKSAQIREILISESAWEEMTCLFAPSLVVSYAEIIPGESRHTAVSHTRHRIRAEPFIHAHRRPHHHAEPAVTHGIFMPAGIAVTGKLAILVSCIAECNEYCFVYLRKKSLYLKISLKQEILLSLLLAVTRL